MKTATLLIILLLIPVVIRGPIAPPSSVLAAVDPDDVIDPDFTLTDVNTLLSPTSPADLDQLRQAVIDLVWSGRGYPSGTPTVEDGVTITNFVAQGNLARIDRLTSDMGQGMLSVGHLFRPRSASGLLVIYHGGHLELLDETTDVQTQAWIARLLSDGHAVIALSMPSHGVNNARPLVDVPRIGILRIGDHDHLKYLPAPLRFYLEPVALALNHALDTGDYHRVAMFGYSGGGWTTTMMAAIDPRIQFSYPVAGSLPIHMRSRKDWGDWEQTDPALYRTATYPELYVLGASGPGRRQVQINNKHDPCCFSGIKDMLYVPQVRARVTQIGPGGYDFYRDEQMLAHGISDPVFDAIARDIATGVWAVNQP